MPKYNQLASIIDGLIAYNLSLDRHNVPKTSSYSRDYITVSYNPGRQVGTSFYIARTATPFDVVICRNYESKAVMDKRIQLINTKEIVVITKNSVNQLVIVDQFKNSIIDKVWIDDASTYTSDELDELYNIFTPFTTQFILLG